MELKIFLRETKWSRMLIISLLWVLPFGCMQKTSVPSSSPPQSVSPLPEESPEPQKQSNPHVLAALQLTQRGATLLTKGEPDTAIRVLERAVSLNPSDGRSYYYLSEAWFMKGNAEQAKEFNRLAELYLQSDTDWRTRVARQSDRIQDLEK
jgi:tetratricopeptide (TPR) repeat protein